MNDLDVAAFRSAAGAETACQWAIWAISHLPLAARKIAAQAWHDGQRPIEVHEALERALHLARQPLKGV